MEELLLQYFVVYYNDPADEDDENAFVYQAEFNNIGIARDFMDWLENAGYVGIRVEVEDY